MLHTQFMTTHEELKRHLGRLILEGYKSRGLTRIEMAEALGVTTRSITALTQGDSVPRVAKRETLERFLGWRVGAIQQFMVEANSATPLEVLNLKWMTPSEETPSEETPREQSLREETSGESVALSEVSAEDLADELLRRLSKAESRVRSLQRQLDEARGELL